MGGIYTEGWDRQKVIDHIQKRSGFKRSYNGISCKYRDNQKPDGTPCFIGCFIPDDKYDRKMDLFLSLSTILHNPSYGILQYMPIEEPHLYDFRYVHDGNITSPPETLRAKLNEFLKNLEGDPGD